MSTPAATAVALHQLVQDAVARNERRVVLPAGEHHIDGSLLPETWCDISNNDSGWKRVLFHVDGARDLEIDGNGARLIIDGVVVPVRLRGCQGVTLRNLTIDWARPGYSEVEVLSSSPSALELAASDQIGSDRGRLRALGGAAWPRDHLWCAIAFDRARGEPLPGATEHWHLERSHRAVEGPGGRIRLEAAWGAGAPPAGSTLVLMHGDRVAPGIVIDACQRTLIEDVTLHHALGMGVVAQCCRDLTLRRYRCVPPPGRMTSSWVDATHAVDCDGAIRLLDCELTGMFDDGTNIHGAFLRVIARPETDLVLLRAEHPQQEGIDYLRQGDRLALHAASSLQRVGEAVVRSVERVNRSIVAVRLDRHLDEVTGLMAMRYAPDTNVEIRGCRIAPVRGRGLLLSAPGRITVEDNHFHSSGAAISLLCDATYWFESGPVEHLLVRGNTFDACAYAGQEVFQILPETADGRFSAPVMRSVHIVDNEIRRVRGRILHARAVADLAFTGNRIAWSTAYPRLDAEPAIVLGDQVPAPRLQTDP